MAYGSTENIVKPVAISATAPQHHWDKVLPPDADFDTADGAGQGSFYFDTTAGKLYVCMDPTATAAVWKDLTLAGPANLSITVAPFSFTNADGHWGTSSTGTGASCYWVFRMPANYDTFVSCSIGAIPSAGAAGASKQMDYYLAYGADGESKTLNLNSNTALRNLTGYTDELYTHVIPSAMFTGVLAGDWCCFEIDHTSVGGTVGYLALQFTYTSA